MLGLLLDKLIVMGQNVDVVNLPAVEVICRKLYGLVRAFEDVQSEAGWKQPRDHKGKWSSKIKWQLLHEYDVRSLESTEWAVPEADEEVSERLKRRALIAKHLHDLPASSPPSTSNE